MGYAVLFVAFFDVLAGDCAAKWMFCLDVGRKCVIFAGCSVYGKMAKTRGLCLICVTM